MNPLFELSQRDHSVYREKLQSFLPDKIIDFHTHVWKSSFCIDSHTDMNKPVKWPRRVANENSIEDLIQTYELMFPGKQVTPVIFGTPHRNYDLEQMNRYVCDCARTYDFPAFMLSTPEMDCDEMRRSILDNGFAGIKVYLDFAPTYIPQNEIRIYDFFPPCQLQLINDLGLIAILHIPRIDRLKDNVNLQQMLEIDEKYPNAKIIIAHIGRAYSDEDLGNSMDILSKTQNLLFDISANTNSYVFRRVLETFGSKRILFGSDLPVVRMRMRRITECGRYVNLVPKGIYGDLSGDLSMREVENEDLTFFIYEEILAFKAACEALNLGREEINCVFFQNAARLLA